MLRKKQVHSAAFIRLKRLKISQVLLIKCIDNLITIRVTSSLQVWSQRCVNTIPEKNISNNKSDATVAVPISGNG